MYTYIYIYISLSPSPSQESSRGLKASHWPTRRRLTEYIYIYIYSYVHIHMYMPKIDLPSTNLPGCLTLRHPERPACAGITGLQSCAIKGAAAIEQVLPNGAVA